MHSVAIATYAWLILDRQRSEFWSHPAVVSSTRWLRDLGGRGSPVESWCSLQLEAQPLCWVEITLKSKMSTTQSNCLKPILQFVFAPRAFTLIHTWREEGSFHPFLLPQASGLIQVLRTKNTIRVFHWRRGFSIPFRSFASSTRKVIWHARVSTH